jgi:hypothetical protein
VEPKLDNDEQRKEKGERRKEEINKSVEEGWKEHNKILIVNNLLKLQVYQGTSTCMKLVRAVVILELWGLGTAESARHIYC